MRNEEDYKLELNKNTYRAIKALTNTNIDVEKYILDCIEDYKLFVQESEKFYSKSLLNRMLEYEKKKAINQANGRLGGRPKKTEKKPTAFKNKTEKNQNKVKERKINKNKLNKKEQEEKIHFAEFVSMTNAEYEKLVSTYGKTFVDQCIVVLDNYKGSSGRNYKNDYRAILSWVVNKLKSQEINPKSSFQKYDQRNYSNLDKIYANKQGGN